jgi:hypothetical protein
MGAKTTLTHARSQPLSTRWVIGAEKRLSPRWELIADRIPAPSPSTPTFAPSAGMLCA